MEAPDHKWTGNARLLCDIAVSPVASVKVTVESATTNSVLEELVDGYIGRTTKSLWNLAVSMPPKRTEPVFASYLISMWAIEGSRIISHRL